MSDPEWGDGDSGPRFTRREFLRTVGLSAASLVAIGLPSRAPAQLKPIPLTGVVDPRFPGLAQVDDVILAAMRKDGYPGGQVAIMFDREVVFNRAYGVSGDDPLREVQPTTLMRWASVEKALVSSAINVLIDQGWRLKKSGLPLTLETRLVQVMVEGMGVEPMRGIIPDPRVGDITVAHLLRHTANLQETYIGWDLVKALDLTAAPTVRDMLKWVISQPLKADPGTVPPETKGGPYSNTGYHVLGQFIHWFTGDYVRFVDTQLFRPGGSAGKIARTRSRPCDRDPLETGYRCAQSAPSLHPAEFRKTVPLCDGYTNWDNLTGTAASATSLLSYLSYFAMFGSNLVIDKGTGKHMHGLAGGVICFGSYHGTSTFIEQDWGQMTSVACAFNDQPSAPPKGEKSVDVRASIKEIMKSVFT